MNLLHCTALSVFGVALAAQNVTSPPGYLATDGGGAAWDFVGAYAGQYTHVVHVDQAFVSQGARTIRSLALRRDAGAPTDSTYVARSLPVQIAVAHSDFSRIINGESIEDSALRLTPWQTVFADRVVSMPSFVNQPTGVAPWQLTFPFDSAFAYTAAGALTVHVRFGPNPSTPSNYPLDSSGELSEEVATGIGLNGGCQVAGRSGPMRLSSMLFNYGDIGSQTVLRCILDRGVGSAPWILCVGLSDPNVAIGACTPVRTSAQLVIGAGVTSSAGYSNLAWSFRHQPHLVGANFYLQTFQADAAQPGLPAALSNGVRQPYPTNPVLPPHAISVSWSASSSFGTGHSFYKGGSLVFGVGY